MKRTLTVFLLTILFIGSAKAQNIKQLFEEGKSLFDQEKYALALGRFEPLTAMQERNDMVRYASFYYAVSAYETGDVASARSAFKQIQTKYPNWKIQDEVNLWLGKIAVEEGETAEAFQFLNDINSDRYEAEIQVLKKAAVNDLTYQEQLKSLLVAFPENVVANRLAQLIAREDVAVQDTDLLEELRENYELTVSLTQDPVDFSPKKSVYNVGLFLPFVYREDSARLVQMQDTWTTRMYYGARLGIEKLKEEGIDLNLIAVDTRDGEKSLSSMINSGELDELDLVLGPVTQSSVNLMSDFTKEREINMINPLSSNGDILKENPFAFLYYPANESLAMRSAEYARENFTRNKNVAVFYSGQADYERAELYRQLIEKDSFDVTIFQRVPPDQSVDIQQLFVEEEEVEKDSLVIAEMMAEMDSLREAEVEDWEIYSERDFVYDTLKILPDSIGHIFIASDYSSLTASALSGIAARPDTVELITSSRFLAAEQSVSFEQLDKLNAIFVGSNFMDYASAEVEEFRERYVNTYLSSPVKEERLGDAYLAYDIIVTFGRLMHQHGKYFQLALREMEAVEGELTDKLSYRLSNDNRYMPFLRVKGAKVVEVKKQ